MALAMAVRLPGGSWQIVSLGPSGSRVQAAGACGLPGQSATAEPQRSSMWRVFQRITEPAQVSTNMPTMM